MNINAIFDIIESALEKKGYVILDGDEDTIFIADKNDPSGESVQIKLSIVE